MRNISVGGMRVDSDRVLPGETEIHLEALARIEDTLYRLKISGWIARSDDAGMGIQFGDVNPTTSAQIKALIDALA